ncbi:MAG: helix-hairpin-helix domain-containing protein [Candidatus Bruticola sp.]
MSENDRYKQALEDNFGQNSGANAKFGNPNVQKLLQQMDSDREIHTHSWSEDNLASSSSRKRSSSNSTATDALAGFSGKDRFVPSQQDLIKSISSSHSKSSSGSYSSSSRSSSGSSSSGYSKKNYPDPDNSTLTKETKRFVVGLGLLCFIIGAILITFLYSPLNERGAERVLDGTVVASPTETGGSNSTSNANDNSTISKVADADNNNNDDSIILEVDSNALSGGELQIDKKTLPVAGKIKLDGIKVYVVGAVKHPGIVTLPFDSRVDDAIKAAGGMTDNAEPLSVNLAKRIKDEDKIYVAVKGEEDNTLGDTGVVEQKSDTSGIIADKTKNSPSNKVAASSAENSNEGSNKANEKVKEESAEFTVNLNSATEEELQKIPGIGPSISKSIIDKRNSLPEGKFTNKAQLKDVIGVGDSSYSKFEPYLEL